MKVINGADLLALGESLGRLKAWMEAEASGRAVLSADARPAATSGGPIPPSTAPSTVPSAPTTPTGGPLR